MANFLYYVPGTSKLTLEKCKSVGLGYAFDASPTPRSVGSGPDGSGGCILAATDDPLPGYFPGKQTWRKIPKNESGVWIGFWNDLPKPTPYELQRQQMVPGKWLTFDDDNQWLAPHARRFEEVEGKLCWSICLPTTMGMDEDGEIIEGEVKPAYQRLWRLAMLWEERYLAAAAEAPANAGMVRFDFPEADEVVSLALQANYRVSLIELVTLGVYDERMRSTVLDVLVDTETQQDFFKKKLATILSAANDSGDSSSGQSESKPASPASTTRPLQT